MALTDYQICRIAFLMVVNHGGYDFAGVRLTLDEFGFTARVRSRGEGAKAIKQEAGFNARRWVV